MNELDRLDRKVLNEEQKESLVEWIAAGYSNDLIAKRFRDNGWGDIDRHRISVLRVEYGATVEQVKAIRYSTAMENGLSQIQEIIARLEEHADELEYRKWHRDKAGRFPNEKAWRETLELIADLMGFKHIGVEHKGQVNIQWDGMMPPPKSSGQK
jgi:hypothetical protein